MINEDLRQPLKKRRLRDRLAALKPSALQATAAACIFGFAGVAAWAVHNGDPMAGEPMVTVAIEA